MPCMGFKEASKVLVKVSDGISGSFRCITGAFLAV